MFSLIRPKSALSASSTVAPPKGSAFSAARSTGLRFATSCAREAANFWKSSVLATKSVSQLTSTIAPAFASGATYTATTPSAAVRAAARDALLPSLMRRSSSALAELPSASTSAFLHSIIGASVLSRRSLTMLAVISAITGNPAALEIQKKGASAPLLGRNRGSLRLRARLFDFDEFIRGCTDDFLHDLAATFQDRIGDPACIQANRPAGVVVARNHVGDPVRRMVGIDDPDNGDAELFRLGDRSLLVTDVDHEQRIGPVVQRLDAPEAALQLGELSLEVQGLFLGQLLQAAVFDHRLHFLEPLDRLADGLEVREHPAEPAMIDEGRAAALRLLADDLARLTLGSDEQKGALDGGKLAHEFHRLLIHHHRLLEIDDVDLVAMTEDEGRHLRVPVAGLVAEMYARFEHLTHRGRHDDSG